MKASAQTTAGFLEGLLQSALSGEGREVQVIGLQGALSSKATIAEVTLADQAGVWLRLSNITLDWSRLALLRGRLEVARLEIAEAEVLRRPQPTAPTVAPIAPPGPAPSDGWLPGPDVLANPDVLPDLGRLAGLPTPEAGTRLLLPDLPVAVEIAALRIGTLRLGAPLLGAAGGGLPAQLTLEGRANLVRGEGEIDLSVSRTDATGGNAHVRAGFANLTSRLRLDIGLDEPAGGIVAGALGIPDQPSLRLALSGAGRLDDFAAKLRLDSDGTQRIAGDLRLWGASAGDIAFEAELAGDPTALLADRHHAFFGPDTRLHLTGDRTAEGALTLQTVSLVSAQLEAQGRAELAPGGAPRTLDLTLNLAAPEGGTVLLPLPGAATTIGTAGLRLGYDAASGDDGWRVSGHLGGLSAPGIALAKVDLDGSGRLDTGPGGALRRLGGTLRLIADGVAPTDAALGAALGPTLSATGVMFWSADAPAELNLRRLRLLGADYALQAAATVSPAAALPAASDQPTVPGWTGDLSLRGQATLSAQDLSRFGALAGQTGLGGAGQIDLTGQLLPITAEFDGQAQITGRNLTIGLAEVDRLLAGDSNLHADARRDGAGVVLRHLRAQAGGGLSADLSGQIASGAADLDARIEISDLSVLGTGYAGGLSLAGRIMHAEGRDQASLRGTANGLRVATGLPEVDGLLAGEVALALEGSRAGKQIDLADLRIDAGPLSVQGAGQLGGGASDLRLTADLRDLGALGRGRAGRLALEASVTGPAEAEALTLAARAEGLGLGLGAADAVLAGNGQLTLRARRADGAVLIEAVDLITRGLEARGRGRWQAGASSLDLSARLTDLGVLLPEIPGPLELTGSLREMGAEAAVDLRAIGPAGLDMRILGVAAPDGSQADLAMTGRFDALLANVLIAPAALRGPVVADLRLVGPLALASLSGSLRLDGLRAAIPEPALALEAITGRIDLADGTARIALGARPQTGGAVSIDGSARLIAPYQGDLRLAFARAIFRDPQLYETDVSGELRILGPLGGGGAISGTLRLGETNLRIATTGAGGFGDLPGLEHVAAPAAVRTTLARAGLSETATLATPALARPFDLDLMIEAPRRIFVRGRGLDAEMGGQVQVRGTTADVLPAGGFDLVRGRLDLLGKRFVLTEGSATMEGRFIPRLRFVATTATPEGEARIELEGPADAPLIRFVSEPPLPQEEVVAQLLFGRDLTTLSPFQAAQLASALASLAGTGGDGVVDALRRGTGLDDLDILTDETGAAGVRVGKYLSQNLYADVTLNPDGSSEVTLNLDVTPTVTARGRLGDAGQTGLGVFYERDY